MRRSTGILLAVILGLPALMVLASRPASARVLAKSDRIRIIESTGQWFHDFQLLVVVPNGEQQSTPGVDSFNVSVSREIFDASRVGARVRLNHLPVLRRVSWISDTSSAFRTVARFAAAQIKDYNRPAAVSPLAAQTAGLARIVAVHSIRRKQPLWRTSDGGEGANVQWIHLIEVEFWALRVRTLVRTIDVVDAGSIPGLHPGDIVQMHYDQNEPRTLRLDDGRRTFAAGQ